MTELSPKLKSDVSVVVAGLNCVFCRFSAEVMVEDVVGGCV